MVLQFEAEWMPVGGIADWRGRLQIADLGLLIRGKIADC
jgi:hypothetical protein